MVLLSVPFFAGLKELNIKYTWLDPLEPSDSRPPASRESNEAREATPADASDNGDIGQDINSETIANQRGRDIDEGSIGHLEEVTNDSATTRSFDSDDCDYHPDVEYFEDYDWQTFAEEIFTRCPSLAVLSVDMALHLFFVSSIMSKKWIPGSTEGTIIDVSPPPFSIA